VFVDIKIDVSHLVETVRAHFKPSDHVYLAGTIQFGSAIQTAARLLAPTMPNVTVPQALPLSKGEVLGCTAPRLVRS
jgi:2-(3-amino-3-carboxypropyl)histidine synthase